MAKTLVTVRFHLPEGLTLDEAVDMARDVVRIGMSSDPKKFGFKPCPQVLEVSTGVSYTRKSAGGPTKRPRKYDKICAYTDGSVCAFGAECGHTYEECKQRGNTQLFAGFPLKP